MVSNALSDLIWDVEFVCVTGLVLVVLTFIVTELMDWIIEHKKQQ